jgi:hypothetical protein
LQDQPQEYRIGRHQARFEPPNLLCVAWEGEVSAADMKAVYDLIESLASPSLLVLNDASRVSAITAGTRQVSAMDPRLRQIRAIASVVPRFHIRVMVMMIARAVSLFHKELPLQSAFFDTAAAARAWLASQR